MFRAWGFAYRGSGFGVCGRFRLSSGPGSPPPDSRARPEPGAARRAAGKSGRGGGGVERRGRGAAGERSGGDSEVGGPEPNPRGPGLKSRSIDRMAVA